MRWLMFMFCMGIVALFLSTARVNAQTIGAAHEENIPAGEFSLDLQSSLNSYAGKYKFGFSEWESDLVLTVRNGRVSGVLTYNELLGNF